MPPDLFVLQLIPIRQKQNSGFVVAKLLWNLTFERQLTITRDSLLNPFHRVSHSQFLNERGGKNNRKTIKTKQKMFRLLFPE